MQVEYEFVEFAMHTFVLYSPVKNIQFNWNFYTNFKKIKFNWSVMWNYRIILVLYALILTIQTKNIK